MTGFLNSFKHLDVSYTALGDFEGFSGAFEPARGRRGGYEHGVAKHGGSVAGMMSFLHRAKAWIVNSLIGLVLGLVGAAGLALLANKRRSLISKKKVKAPPRPDTPDVPVPDTNAQPSTDYHANKAAPVSDVDDLVAGINERYQSGKPTQL